MGLLHNSRTPRGWGLLLTTHYPLLTSYPLKPLPHMAHPYTCTCKKGPAAREPRYSTMRRFLIAIVSLAVLPAIASAQRGGMGAGMAHPAMAAPAPHVAMHASPPAGAHVTSQLNSGTHYVSGMRYVRTRSGAIVARPIPHSTASVQRAGSGRQLLSQDMVPGLGFDYAHVAAIHPNGFNGPGRNRRLWERFSRSFMAADTTCRSLPMTMWTMRPWPNRNKPIRTAASTQTAEPERPARPSRDYVPAPQTASEKEAEQYVFVRRDGTVFFASAYAWENGTLRYITSEGLRHTVTADKLDLTPRSNSTNSVA